MNSEKVKNEKFQLFTSHYLRDDQNFLGLEDLLGLIVVNKGDELAMIFHDQDLIPPDDRGRWLGAARVLQKFMGQPVSGDRGGEISSNLTKLASEGFVASISPQVPFKLPRRTLRCK